MRSPNKIVVRVAVVYCLLNGWMRAIADTRIRGEFEYNINDEELSEWQIGPAFELNDETELEIPIGQEDGIWLIQPELTYEIETDTLFEIELEVGVEIPFSNEPIEGFGGIEGSIDF